MSPPSYKQNKKHIYSWRENNQDRYKELNLKHQIKFQTWKKIQKEFLQILL
jgi:hypothetical protein